MEQNYRNTFLYSKGLKNIIIIILSFLLMYLVLHYILADLIHNSNCKCVDTTN